jgi:hypothetical protein
LECNYGSSQNVYRTQRRCEKTLTSQNGIITFFNGSCENLLYSALFSFTAVGNSVSFNAMTICRNVAELMAAKVVGASGGCMVTFQLQNRKSSSGVLKE